VLLLKSGRAREAIDHLQAAVRLDPHHDAAQRALTALSRGRP